MLMVTAGIVRVSLAITTAPFDSTARDGLSRNLEL